MKKLQERIYGIVFVILIMSVFITNVLAEDMTVSLVENRKLQAFPALNLESLLNGDFSDEFNDYVRDQQILKEELNSLASFFNYQILQKKEIKGIVLDNDSLYELLIHNKYNIHQFGNQLLKLQSRYGNHNQYTVIVPDKSYYLEGDYPDIGFEYLELYDLLDQDDYYDSDLHLRNEGSYKIYQYLADVLGYKAIEVDFSEGKSGFSGFYSVKSSYPIEDEIHKPVSDILNQLLVRSMNDKGDFEEHLGCYYEDVSEHDLYSYMLDGNKAVTIIENKVTETDRELVVFKDSYALSLAPFLAQNYSKVTLIDLRLIPASLADEYISKDADILYYYGFKSLNSNISLK